VRRRDFTRAASSFIQDMTGDQNETFARLAALVAARRDRDAFVVLFDHFAPRINAYLQRLGMERAVAEDLTQEVMVVLWHKAGLFDPQKSSLSTWLFRIARNRRIDALRRDRSRVLDPDDPIFLPDEIEAADTSLDARRREERIRTAVAALPEEQRDLIRQAYFLGLTHSQIAEASGLPLGTVKSRIRLAFARLRKALEADPRVDTD
jgi:RNA polymerase sigma-70 factor (ECF subfamily)